MLIRLTRYGFVKIIKNISKQLTTKDDMFWEEYTKMKKQGGRIPALPTQGIVANDVLHSWRYSDKYSLINTEFLDCLTNLKRDDKSPFLVLDVREEIEYELFKLPLKNKVQVIA
jgi:hypothetical protein